MNKIPPLEPHCGSWMVCHPDGTVAFETFSAKTAQIYLERGYVVKTAAQYLGELNNDR